MSALARMALDRRQLRSTPGLNFWKLLGTGHGRTFSVRDADPTTWGLFAVWESHEAYEEFLSSSSYVRIWSRLAVEQWRAELAPTRWRGTWSGANPFGEGDSSAEPMGRAAIDEPLAVLTRARVRPSKWRSFAGAVPPVAAAVNTTPGLRYTVGVGEAPIGLQATFSLWDSTSAMTSFAYGQRAHLDVVDRTKSEGWYAEEMFARFRVVSTAGSIDGRSP